MQPWANEQGLSIEVYEENKDVMFLQYTTDISVEINGSFVLAKFFEIPAIEANNWFGISELLGPSMRQQALNRLDSIQAYIEERLRAQTP